MTENPDGDNKQIGPSSELKDPALDAGLVAAFSSESTVFNPSVLRSLCQRTDRVPRVFLKSPAEEGLEPVVRPNSNEMGGTVVAEESRYRIDGEIARGGMGAILKGRDTDLGRDLAVKVLLDEHKAKPAVIQRFIEEAQIGGQLQHPGIVPVYELGQFQDERPFFTMKLVKGKTLAALLAERRSPECDRAKLMGIFEQICQTLAYAHSRGVIHRDLKPSNVMVGAFGEVQVMDWGLAKVLTQGGVVDEKRAEDRARSEMSIIQTIRSLGSDTPAGFGSGSGSARTAMGSVMGTPAYMAPEQALGEIDRLDERVDVFGLGSMLCEILTGKPAYAGENRVDVFRKASRAKLQECHERLAESSADEDLIQLALDCLEPEPDDRIRDAGKLAKRVSEHLESVETRLRNAELARVEANTQAAEERKRRRVLVALGASTILTMVVLVGGWLWGQQKDAALQQAATEAERRALIQRSQREQQISRELSTARALGFTASEDLPDLQSLSRAVEAADRAKLLTNDGEVNESLKTETLELLTVLRTLKRDADLVAALDRARGIEMDYTVRRADESDVSVYDGQASNQVKLPNPSAPYKEAFSNWGLEPTPDLVPEAIKKISAIPATLQPTVLDGLDRWRRLIHEPLTLDQWQQADWTPLEPVELVSRTGDQLQVLEDGSILATGENAYGGYELSFETAATDISVMRLQVLLHDAFPNRGPGRGPDGTFCIEDLAIYFAPKSSSVSRQKLKLRHALASQSWQGLPIQKDKWHSGYPVGTPVVAVFVAEVPIRSESGFQIWIEHADRRRGQWEEQNLGRFSMVDRGSTSLQKRRRTSR